MLSSIIKITFVTLTCILIYSVYFIINYFPKIENLKTEQIEITVQNEKPIYTFKKHTKNWVPIKNISKYVASTVMISEDWSFLNHNGIDFNQLFDAIEESIKEKKLVRGASTITQQVAKNVFLSSEKTIIRKIKELVLTIKIEKSLSKQKILEIYLNIAQWGKNIYGIKQASYHYFNKAPSQVNEKEAAFLAFLLPSPMKYSISFKKMEYTKFAHKTINDIYKKMLTAGIISSEKYNEFIGAPEFFYKKTESIETLLENQFTLSQ